MSASLSAVKEEVKRRALSYGVGAFAVCRAQIDVQVRQQFEASVERGDLATWRYDASYAQRACDATTLLEGAQSVICIALPYRRPTPLLRSGYGRVSSYAWGSDDYHRRMQQTLGRIAADLETLSGVKNSLIVCDTKPFAERAYAARAGLGWIGKHTNLIVAGLGSFVFLGEIVTTCPLPVDVPRKTHCGSCRRCVAACPTGALRGDYTMDATRCISDLTQRKDAIPRAFRPLIGTWIWGCDICQDVCPPTQQGAASDDDYFSARDEAFPDLLHLLTLDRAGFEKRFRQTAMGWRGPTLLRRNAAVALGNWGDRATVPALLAALDHEESSLVRQHIAWALGRIGSPSAYAGMTAMLRGERDPAVAEELQLALKERLSWISAQ